MGKNSSVALLVLGLLVVVGGFQVQGTERMDLSQFCGGMMLVFAGMAIRTAIEKIFHQ